MKVVTCFILGLLSAALSGCAAEGAPAWRTVTLDEFAISAAFPSADPVCTVRSEERISGFEQVLAGICPDPEAKRRLSLVARYNTDRKQWDELARLACPFGSSPAPFTVRIAPEAGRVVACAPTNAERPGTVAVALMALPRNRNEQFTANGPGVIYTMQLVSDDAHRTGDLLVFGEFLRRVTLGGRRLTVGG